MAFGSVQLNKYASGLYFSASLKASSIDSPLLNKSFLSSFKVQESQIEFLCYTNLKLLKRFASLELKK